MSLTKRDYNIEKLLLEDSHIVKIHPPKEYDVPPIKLNLWSPEKREAQGKRLDRLVNYLRSPCIEDDFGNNHDARREWRQSKPWFLEDTPIREYYQSNPLKINTYTLLVHTMPSLGNSYIGTNPKKFKALRDSVDKLIYEHCVHKDYERLSTQEKLELVEKCKKNVYGLLLFLSKQRPFAKKRKKS